MPRIGTPAASASRSHSISRSTHSGPPPAALALEPSATTKSKSRGSGHGRVAVDAEHLAARSRAARPSPRAARRARRPGSAGRGRSSSAPPSDRPARRCVGRLSSAPGGGSTGPSSSGSSVSCIHARRRSRSSSSTRCVRRVGREVVRLAGIEHEVVELLLGQGALGQPMVEQVVLARAVVDVREHGSGVAVVEAADVLVALRAHRALRLVGGVERDLRKHRVVALGDRAASGRAPTPAARSRPARRSSGRGRSARRARRRPCRRANPGPRTISITPMPRSVSVAFAPGKASPWSVVRITSVLSSAIASSTVPTPWSSERALAL